MLGFSFPDLSLFLLDATTITMLTAAGFGVLLMAYMSGRYPLRTLARDQGCRLSRQGMIARRTAPDLNQARALPTVREANSIGDLERLFRQMAKPQNQNETYRRFIERSGVSLKPQELWLLQRLSPIVGARAEDLPAALRHPEDRLAGPLAALQSQGLVSNGEDSLTVTDEGRAMLDRIEQARARFLAELFSEWAPGGHYEIQRILDRFTKSLRKTMPPEEECTTPAGRTA